MSNVGKYKWLLHGKGLQIQINNKTRSYYRKESAAVRSTPSLY